jgi:putative ABC transport system permease protein
VIGFSGGYRSALIIGLQGIRSRKTRTFLSMVSLFLGVLAVVVVATAAEIAEKAALANVEYSMGVDGTRFMGVPADGQKTEAILDTLAERSDAVAIAEGGMGIIGEPGVAPVNPGAMNLEDVQMMGPGGGMGYGGPMYCDDYGCYPVSGAPAQAPPGQAVEFSLQAMTGDVRQFKPYRIEAGQWLDFSDEPSLAPRVVINKRLAAFFSAYQFPAEFRLNGATANMTPRIIGVVDDAGWGPTAYVRADEIMNWMPAGKGIFESSGGGWMNILMTPDSFDTEQILRAKLAALGVPADQLQPQTINSRDQAETVLLIMQIIFYALAGLVLLIGVAGIINVSLATVGERIEEFALRRAVGTPRLLLAGIVLAETLLTGLFTAGVAIGFAALALKAVGPFMGGGGYIGLGVANPTFPWQAAVAGIIAGLFAGVLGGLIPAIRAARIPIATVMRA